MKKLTTLFALLATFLALSLNAQVAINNDGTDADSDAILHVKDGSNNDVFYIDAATGAVVVHSLTPFAGDIFSSYASGDNWAINGYAVNVPALYGETSGSGNAILGNSSGGAGVYGTSSSSVGVAGVIDNSTSFSIWAQNVNSSGTGLFVIGNNVSSPSYLTNGSGGAFNGSSIGLVSWGKTAASGTGVVGSGNNIGSPNVLTNGSGGSFTGTNIGAAGWGELSSSGTGVVGVGNNGNTAMTYSSGSGGAFTGTYCGVYGQTTGNSGDRFGGYFRRNDNAVAWVGARISNTNYKILGNGTASTIVKDLQDIEVIMYCPEAPEVLFQDYGIGQLINGRAYIELDPIITKNINVSADRPLKVFVTLEGDCNGVYVTNKSATGFEVIELQDGSSDVSFSWQIVATRANEEFLQKDGSVEISDYSKRFPPVPDKLDVVRHEIQSNEIISLDDAKMIHETNLKSKSD